MRRKIGTVALAGYVATVVLANYFIQHVGHVSFPGGPHTIPVGFGYDAPSGVLWVGLAFTLRDFVQSNLGKRWTVAAILVGAGLSYFVAPSLAAASATAFLVSEALDFAVYTPLVERIERHQSPRVMNQRWLVPDQPSIFDMKEMAGA